MFGEDYIVLRVTNVVMRLTCIVLCVLGGILFIKSLFTYNDAMEKAQESNACICDKFISNSFFGDVHYYVVVEYDVEPALLEKIPWYLNDDAMQKKIQVTELFYNDCRVGDLYVE